MRPNGHLAHTGSTYGTIRAAVACGTQERGIEGKVWPLIASRRSGDRFGLSAERASALYARMATSQHIGKIVLTV